MSRFLAPFVQAKELGGSFVRMAKTFDLTEQVREAERIVADLRLVGPFCPPNS